MIAATYHPLTFIDSNPLSSEKGRQLSLIRSHTATLQQRQRRKKRWRFVEYPGPGATFVETGIDPKRRPELVVRGNETYNGDALPAQRIICNDDTRCACHNTAAPPHTAPSSEEGDRQYACCYHPTMQALVSAFESRLPSESHRNDPFGCLPMPASKEVSTLLDYCEITYLHEGIH
jgi:hypothetical protein